MKKRFGNKEFRGASKGEFRGKWTDTEFLQDYEESINKLKLYLSRANPDYIIALSRTGPRLLEFLNERQYVALDCPVITERSLDFVDNNELTNKNILVFDDLIISGTTMWSLLDELWNSYDLNSLEAVTTGLDTQTVARNAFNPDTGTIRITQGDQIKTIPWTWFEPLNTNRRFNFVDQLSNSIYTLNKPYDLDFPLFSMIRDDRQMENLLAANNAYDVTLEAQSGGYLARYTVLPKDADVQQFYAGVFSIDFENSGLNKVRIYRNRVDNATTIAPMAIFELKEDLTTRIEEECSIFSPKFEWCNVLIKQADTFLDGQAVSPTKRNEILYRVVWYLTSTLFGIFWFANQDDEFICADPAEGITPFQSLERGDIELLFGPTFSEIMFESIVSNWDTARTHLSLDETPSLESAAEGFEPLTELNHEWYNELEETFSESLDDADNIGFAIGWIFDSIYTEIERHIQEVTKLLRWDNSIETVRTSEETSLSEEINQVHRDGGGYAHPAVLQELKQYRLDTGFSFKELLYILDTHTGFSVDAEFRRRASLAVDVLIDKGIQIPEFVVSEKDGETRLYRGYRHGENAPKGKRGWKILLGFALDKFYANTPESAIGSVELEKLVCLISVHLSNELDLDMLNTKEEGVYVSTDFDMYGRVVQIGSRGHFVHWGEQNGMIEEFDGGYRKYKYSAEWHREEIKWAEQRNSKAECLAMGEFASMLYDIQRTVELPDSVKEQFEGDDYPHGNFDLLVSLSTCSNPTTYMRALLKEFQLLFDYDVKQSSFSAILKLNEIFNEPVELPMTIRGLNDLDQAVNEFRKTNAQIKTKMALWQNFDSIYYSINQHIEEELKPEYENASKDHERLAWDELNDLLENIDAQYYIPQEHELLDVGLKLVEGMARVVHKYCLVLEGVVEMSTSIEQTMQGEEYRQIGNLNEKVNDFNEEVEDTIPELKELAREVKFKWREEDQEDDWSSLEEELSLAKTDAELANYKLSSIPAGISGRHGTTDTTAIVRDLNTTYHLLSDVCDLCCTRVNYYLNVTKDVQQNPNLKLTDIRWVAYIEFRTKESTDSEDMDPAYHARIELQRKSHFGHANHCFGSTIEEIKSRLQDALSLAERNGLQVIIGVCNIRDVPQPQQMILNLDSAKERSQSFITENPIDLARDIAEVWQSNRSGVPEGEEDAHRIAVSCSVFEKWNDQVIPDSLVNEGEDIERMNVNGEATIRFLNNERTVHHEAFRVPQRQPELDEFNK